MAEPLWRTPPARLAPPHVYRMAGALGAELRRLSARFGPDAVAGLVPPVVRLLELLEALVAPGWWLFPGNGAGTGVPRFVGRLRPRLSRSLWGPTARKEREVMLRLKEVVDRQRDELRAQAHEIVCKSRDTEALQEQLQRFMAMNEELRHKVAVVQAQLKSALEQKSDLEAETPQLKSEQCGGVCNATNTFSVEPQHQDGDRSPAHCCFSKEELQQILQERNELKTNLFLVQEELAYYQRELLNEERIPSFFLDAMKSNIKKQRKKIRAKMLGTTEESGTLLCSLCSFGLWYQGSSKDPPTPSCSGTWEIIDSLDSQLEPEGESKAGSSCPDRATAAL
uniref:Rab interacting lysosomal protein n=1 Tax=Junco hyemalis TaxID=40217 RepID=A0A8C5J1F8_JUNHY